MSAFEERPMVTFPAAGRHCPLAGIKLVTDTHE